MDREHLELIGLICGLLGVILGPGGVFYLLFKRGINGTVESVKGIEKTLSKVSGLQNMDHETLVKVGSALEAIQQAQKHYHRLVDENVKSIVKIQTRCEALHAEWFKHIMPDKEG